MPIPREVVGAIRPKVREGAEDDRVIAALAHDQHGVVSRVQLLGAGLTPDGIRHRLRCGRLHPIHRGVYAVGHRVLTRDALFMAAVLACGEGAALSHRAAIAHWGMRPWSEGRIDVTTRGGGGTRRKGLRLHRSELEPDEITILRGVPVTTVPRTLIDFATTAGRREVERAMNEAEVRKLAGFSSLAAFLDGHRSRPGSGTVRQILDAGRPGQTWTRNDFEELFLEFVERAGLPVPLFNQPVRVGGRTIEVDCLWPEQRVVLELDGREVHHTAHAFESDRARDRALTAAGWRPMRATWRQLRFGRRELERDLRAVL